MLSLLARGVEGVVRTVLLARMGMYQVSILRICRRHLVDHPILLCSLFPARIPVASHRSGSWYLMALECSICVNAREKTWMLERVLIVLLEVIVCSLSGFRLCQSRSNPRRSTSCMIFGVVVVGIVVES